MCYAIAAPKNWERGHFVRFKSVDREPLSFSNSKSGRQSLSAGSRALSALKTNARLPIITTRNNVIWAVFFLPFSLDSTPFRYKFLRRVRISSIPQCSRSNTERPPRPLAQSPHLRPGVVSRPVFHRIIRFEPGRQNTTSGSTLTASGMVTSSLRMTGSLIVSFVTTRIDFF
jgi:hypothetical protein